MNILMNGITAHRGNSEKFPENTVEAFLSGVAVGADWLELDIRFSADGYLVVIHDAETGRTADFNRVVAESSLNELKQLDFAFQFRKDIPGVPVMRISTLEDVFSAVGKDCGIGISIQPKNTGADGIAAVDKAIELARKMGVINVIGFNDGQLNLMRHVKNSVPEVPVFYDIPYPDPQFLEEALEYGFESLVCFKDNITEEWGEAVKAAGIIPGAWTVNSIAEFKKLHNMGVKRFYTDCPRQMLEDIQQN
jgi:glycerophosphoryl diester phosphodiesterase